jgi:two-component sensor histidine kinase
VVRALIAQLRGNFRLSTERGTEFTIDWDA